MTENSVPNLHPTPQPSTPNVELSWDDIADGTFPPTRQQRLLQAALQATELLKERNRSVYENRNHAAACDF